MQPGADGPINWWLLVLGVAPCSWGGCFRGIAHSAVTGVFV